MKKIILFLLLPVILTLVTCKKEERTMETIVEGTVKDATTGLPIPSARVYLLAYESACWVCGSGYPVNKFFCDANGTFSFQFTAEEKMSYNIAAAKEKYRDSPTQGLAVGNKNKINLVMEPSGLIRLFVENVYPAKDTDTILFSSIGGGTYDFVGKDVKETIEIPVPGNKSYEIKWVFSRIKPLIYYRDTVFVPAFDTTEYYLNY